MGLYLGHVSILVDDLKKSEQFYTHLGMNVISRFAEYLFLKGSQGILGLRKKPINFHTADQVLEHFGFFVTSMDELQDLREKLLDKGVQATPLLKHRDGFNSFYFFDPDGNKIQALYPSS